MVKALLTVEEITQTVASLWRSRAVSQAPYEGPETSITVVTQEPTDELAVAWRAEMIEAPFEHLLVRFNDNVSALQAELVLANAEIMRLNDIIGVMKSETDADKKPSPEPKQFPAGALKPSQGDPRRVGG